MVQFKNVFTGVEKRPYSRAVDRAEMRARRRQAQRPRQCRLYRAPPHVLRDARQFLVRRLFQAAGDRARLETDHPGIRSDEGPAAGHRLSRRRRGLRRCGRRSPASPRIAHHPHRDLRQFLGDGRHRPVRALFGNLLRPRRPALPAARPARPTRTATATSNSGISSSCSTSRLAGGERVAAAAALDRHRHGARAHRRRAAGRARQLRHRPDARADPRQRRSDRRRCRRAAEGEPPRHRRPSARLGLSSSPTACCRRTKGAAMSCAASCAAPCATPSCSARASR